VRCSKGNAEMDLRLMTNPFPAVSTAGQHARRGRHRRLEAADSQHLRAHLLRLHPEDLRSRFMTTTPRHLVHRYVGAIDWRRSLLVGCFFGRSLRGVCELHPIAGRRAEIAISVERRFQGRGIGSALMSRALVLARNRGLTELELRCLVENQRMRRLVGKFDGETAVEAMEASSTIHAQPANAATYVTEMVEQAGVLGTTLIRFWLTSPGAGWPGRCWATPDLFALYRPRDRRTKSAGCVSAG
jgi:RimJ/RimL family protein N-acetyltransferase